MKLQHLLDLTADFSSKFLEATAGCHHRATACTDMYTGCMCNADNLFGKVYVICLQQKTHAPFNFNRDSLTILTACLLGANEGWGPCMSNLTNSMCHCIHDLMLDTILSITGSMPKCNL